MKALTLLAVIVLILMTIAGVIIYQNKPGLGLLLAIGSPLALIFIYFADQRREKREKEVRQQEIASAIKEQLTQAQRGDYVMEVRGSSTLVGVMCALVIACLLILFGFGAHNTIMGLFGIVVFVFSIPISLQAILLFGHPVLTLNRTSFQTPIVGVIPWEAVQGLQLREITVRGNTASHTLTLSVPDLPDRSKDFSVVARMAYWFRVRKAQSTVTVLLKNANPAPAVIEPIASNLWFMRTGRKYMWEAEAPEEYNAALRRMGELSQEKIHALAVEGPDKLVASSQQFLKDSEVIQTEIKRKVSAANWATAAIVVMFLLYAAAKILKHWR